jgi:hypothetical protein
MCWRSCRPTPPQPIRSRGIVFILFSSDFCFSTWSVGFAGFWGCGRLYIGNFALQGAVAIQPRQKSWVSTFHSNFDTSYYFNIQNKLVSHDNNLSFFLLLAPHLTHAPGFFFFFSSSPSPVQRRHSPAMVDPAVTHHLRPNHLRRRSSFPAKPNRKTSKNINPTSKLDSNASNSVSNASKLDSNASKIIFGFKTKT